MKFLKGMLGKQSPEVFAETVRKGLVDRGGQADLTYDAASFSLRKGTAVVGLSNVYELYAKASGAQREQVVDRWLEAIVSRVDVPATFENASERLMPMLRRVEEASMTALEVGVEPTAFLDRAFPLADLCVTVVYDGPNLVARLPAATVEHWNVSADDVWDTAMHNLRLRSADAWEERATGVFVSHWHDVFDAPRVLFTDLLQRLPIAGTSRVMMVPERNVLVVADPASLSALIEMVDIGVAAFEATPYKLSTEILLLREGKLSLFDPPPALKGKIDRPLQLDRLKTYRAQKTMLERIPGEEVFISEPIIAASNDGDIVSIAVWVEAVTHAFMPRAQKIAFQRNDAPSVVVAWDDAMSVIGPLTPEPNLVPVRYRIMHFPDTEQLARLSALGIVWPRSR